MLAASAEQRPPKWPAWALAATSGLLLTLLYPPFDLAILAWIALTPLLIALEGATPRRGFALGWFTGTLGALGVTGLWIFRAARDYFHLSPLEAALFTTATTQIWVSVYFGSFGFAVTRLRRQRPRVLLIPSLFVATEYGRAHLLTGNPWELLGHSQANPLMIQLCDVTGVYGLSFLLAFTAAAAAELRRTWHPAVAAVGIVALVGVYGGWRLATLPARDSLRVTLVQANLPNDQRGRPEFFSANVDQYLTLTRRTSPRSALIVWPENAIGFFPEENAALLAPLMDYLRAHPTSLLAGAPRSGGGTGIAALYNSAYLFTADGSGAVYDKRILLPFVERMPLRPGDGPFLRGATPSLFSVTGHRVGTLICYEAIYPELSRDFVERGAELLVNISNDSWFEAGAGPEQHYNLARFRAVENRVSLVRATNSGISGAFDPSGREIARLPAGRAIAESVDVPVGAGGSFYTRHGDLLAIASIGVSALALLGLFPSRALPSRYSPSPNFSIR